MTFFPDIDLISDANSLGLRANVISQGAAQLLNSPDKDSQELSGLKAFTLKSIGDIEVIINRIKSEIA
jgi:hypothetical protein